MSVEAEKKNVIPNEQEQKLLKIIHQIGFGEIKVIINDGKPIRLEEVRRSIKL
ncbi:DUF2292 domain-containing protein [Aminipila terrae]|uniref:DUF2292 domain-containing protein n=1 Tax=Aminipila terrae TaxID=2697030 RepID=A0A6P1MH50_9FIRM|nr:DUF2292 domain-containing protein [Aminipila terrae]QHI71338.1 DUF2292 domain-containing protein [Aminipila terrae]